MMKNKATVSVYFLACVHPVEIPIIKYTQMLMMFLKHLRLITLRQSQN
jgi:hypothetical protein